MSRSSIIATQLKVEAGGMLVYGEDKVINLMEFLKKFGELCVVLKGFGIDFRTDVDTHAMPFYIISSYDSINHWLLKCLELTFEDYLVISCIPC